MITRVFQACICEVAALDCFQEGGKLPNPTLGAGPPPDVQGLALVTSMAAGTLIPTVLGATELWYHVCLVELSADLATRGW